MKITDLQKVLKISAGKLEHHLRTLENESLVVRKVDLFKTRTLSIIVLTQKGDELINEYIQSLKELLAKIGEEK